MKTTYVLRKQAGGATLYYKSGHDRGWHTNKLLATHYTEEGFANRDRANAFMATERQKIDVVIVKVPDANDDFVFLQALAARLANPDRDRLLAIARDLQEAEEHC